MNFWALFALAMQVATALQSVLAAIAAGQPASTPPISTYIEGKHGQITVNWTPLP